MSYWSDFKELNGGYVTFGGNPKGGKIAGKVKIKTGKLDFDDVYFVKELKLLDASQVLLRVPRENNMYNVNLKNIIPSRDLTCLFAKATLDESNLWHTRLGHVNFKTINKLVKGNLVRGLHSKVFTNDNSCVACRKGKQHRASSSKDETPFVLKTFIIGLENLLSLKVKIIRCDHGTEFKNFDLNQFCGLKGIKREFNVPRTPQQNGIAERKNRTLIEAARTLLADSLLPIPFWAEAVNTACYVQNRTMNYHPVLAENQTNSHAGFQDTEKAGEEGTHTYVLFLMLSDGSTNPHNNNKDALVDRKEHDDDIQKSVSPDIYSLSGGDQTRKQGDKTENKDKGKSPVVSIIGFKDLNAKFEECINNSSNGINAASSSVSTARQNYTNNTNDFSVAGPSNATMPNLEDLLHDADDVGAEADINNMESIISVSSIPITKIHKDHPTSQIISDMSLTTQTRSMARAVRDQGGILQMFNEDFHTCMFACFFSQEEPKRVHQALKDPSWIEAMQEELLQFKMQKVWILVDLPSRKRAIGHTQEEGIDYEEVFAPVARIEAIRLFLAYASFMGFPVYQMDVNSASLYGTIEEEVYVCQPPGFEDPENLDKFWSTAMAKTINGEAHIYAKVDGKKIIITESSVRRDLRLADEEGIDCLPNSTIFEQLALMEVTPLFPSMVVQNKFEMGKGSAMLTDPHYTPTILQPSSQPQKKQTPWKPKRKDTQVPQPSDPTNIVIDEAVHKELGDRLVRATTTASSLEAKQDNGNITKT
nr:hypothetical protein [Tanacetum cinerariifolium]